MKKLQRGEGRPRSTHHIRSGSWCPTKSASLLASAGSGTQRRCGVQAVGFRGGLPETPGQKSRLFYLSAAGTGAKIPFILPIRSFLSDTYGGRVHDLRIAEATP